MQNQILKFRRSFSFPRNQIICLKKLKTLTWSNCYRNFFSWNFAHVSYLNNVYRRVWGCKTRSFLFWKIVQDLNKIKNILNTYLQKLVSRKSVQNFNKKILNSMIVGAPSIFQFFRQNTWFLKNSRALWKLLCGFLDYLKGLRAYNRKSFLCPPHI